MSDIKEEKGHITIECKEDKEFYYFKCIDNGIGVDEKNINKIFDTLFTTDKSRKISGLGLSICKEIIESHNGSIKAINNKMGGFSIIFTIDSYKED
jgi:signal transduction histidine kinase